MVIVSMLASAIAEFEHPCLRRLQAGSQSPEGSTSAPAFLRSIKNQSLVEPYGLPWVAVLAGTSCPLTCRSDSFSPTVQTSKIFPGETPEGLVCQTDSWLVLESFT